MDSRTRPQIALFKLNSVFGDNTVTHVTSGIDSVAPPAVWNNENVLGSGTFGIVWCQKEIQTGQLRAVKVISKTQASTQELDTLVNLRDV